MGSQGKGRIAALLAVMALVSALWAATVHAGWNLDDIRKQAEDAARTAVGGGLTNDEVARCTHLVRIPTAPDYTSINLAQAAMLLVYEVHLAWGAYEPPREKSEPAPAAQRARLMEMWRALMLEIGFMEPHKADHMMHGFQRIFTRGAVTKDDVDILMGVARQTQWAVQRGAESRRGGTS